MRYVLALSVVLALLAGGCSSGGSKKKSATPQSPAVLPAAKTADEWARRVVDRLFRPLNRDLQVLNALNIPDVKIYIASANPDAIRILNRSLADLSLCNARLTSIGPPPKGQALGQVSRYLLLACGQYERVTSILKKAIPMLASGRADVTRQGQRLTAQARPPSGLAARYLLSAVKIAQKQPAFVRAGLQQSA